jgi:hypothetical protein
MGAQGAPGPYGGRRQAPGAVPTLAIATAGPESIEDVLRLVEGLAQALNRLLAVAGTTA